MVDKLRQPHNLFFIYSLFFIIGTLLANIQLSFLAVLLASILILLSYFLPAVFLAAGFGYFYFYQTFLAGFHLLSQTAKQLQFIPEAMKSAYRKLLPSSFSSLLAAVTLGDVQDMPRDLLYQLNNSGIRHITALSGLHFTIIVSSISKGFNVLVKKKRLMFSLSIILSLAFVLLTGLKISALRAALMALIANLAYVVERTPSRRNSLVFAALIILLLDPSSLLNVSFQLSFAALVGIYYLKPLIEKTISWKNDLLFTTLSAQIATAPFLFFYFGQFNPLSVFNNIAVLPLVPFLMTSGYIAGAAYYFFRPLSILTAWSAAAVLRYILFVINL